MKRRTLRILIYLVPIVSIIGLIAIAWYQRERQVSFLSDAATIREPLDAVNPRDVLWSPAVKLPGLLNTQGNEFEPAVSPDGFTLYFVRGRMAHNADLFFSTKTPTGWTEPQPLLTLNTVADELGPEPSADGKSLYFYSDRVGGLGGYDLWVALRDEDGNWSDAVNLGPEVNSRDHDYGPCVSPDGQSLYFASDRPALMEGTAIEGVQVQGRDYDLYVATMGESGLGEVVPVDELNSPSNEGAPSFSESGDFLYFASDRRGGSGGFDLYRSRVVHGQIRTPRNLGDSINTMANEIDPAMTLGGFGIHFSSDRVETEGVASNGLYDLYYAQSREVFIETETHRATIDWAALIALLLPYLIWLLLMLSTMGVLAAVIRRLEYNRMGLLTRCLMGSLIAHLVLLALLTLWGVSTSLSEAISPGSSTRVVLTSPSVGRGIAEQIRGEMTDVEIDAEMEEARQQQFEAEVQPPSFEDAEMELEQTTLESFDLLETQVAMNEAQAQSLDTPDVELLEPAEAQEIEHTTPAEARREQASEAIARVPDTAVSNPTATRALDEATPQPAQTYDTHVAMNVERAEMPNDSNERLAERSGANEARAESSSTLMEVQPTEVSASEARDVPLPFVPVSKNKRTSEAQTNTALKPGEPGELDRQTQAARVEVAQASQSEVELQTPRATQQLAMQSMANPTEAKASTNANEMTPLTSSDVAPQTQASEVALQDMPSQEASKASEAQTRIQVAIAQAGRTDASEAFESAGAPAQAIEVNPEASRLVASERLSNAMSMNEASNEASPLPAMHAKVAESSEASSDLALSTPRLDTQARQQSNEARQATTTQPLPSIRTASVNMPSDLQSTHANEVAVNTQSNPVAMESTTLSHVEIHESSTTSPSELSSSYENAVVMNEPQTVQVDLPSDAGDQGGQSSREANMPPATSLANMTGTSSDSRQTTSTEVQAATSDSQVALNPTQGTLKLDSNSMAGVESRESSTTSEMTLTNPSRQVEPGQQVAMNLELPDEQASGEVRPTSGVEHALMPLVATSRSNRVEHATSSLSETSPASTQVVMSPTRAAPSSESSTLASRTTRDASWQSTQVPALQNSAALPTPSSTTFALDLPMEQESPTQHNAAPSHQQSDRLSKSTIAKYSPSASQSSDPAMTSVVMNPSSQPRESFAHRLFEDALASDNGDTPSLNPPLASQDFAQGLVIPPLAAVSLPGMEQGSQAEQQETRTRQAKRSSQSKQRNRFKQEYLDAPATGTSRRSLTSLPPAIMPASVDVNRQFASRGRVDDSMRLPNDFHLPQPDLDLAKTPEALGMDLNLSLPLEQLVTLDPYKQRADEFRETMVEVMGGSEETEHAVTMGLDWLARHQSRNGSWDGDSFDNQCGECDGRAKVQVDIGLTGLSLLCFLAADHTHLKDGPYRETVERGLRWLRRQQHRTGSIMTNESLYSHGIATIALAEAYGMTGDPELAQPVQRAIDFTFAARNKGVGGWRYGPGQVGDTSVLGWQMMSFNSADRAGLDVPREAL
ncbi:MAG: hypothetical protein O7G85_00570, partial [Planctomycetota bacterium]|nr:hypothetical protein [Planctomycetota bacterium]